MDVNQKIERDGTSEIEIVYDFSAFSNIGDMDFGNSFEGKDEEQDFLSDIKQNLTEFCTEFNDAQTFLQNAKCTTPDDLKISINGEMSLKDGQGFEVTRSIPYVTYRYDAKNILLIMSNISPDQAEEFTDEKLLEAKSMSGLGGTEWTYTLEMPCKITSTDLGMIQDNKVTIDMFDMAKNDHVYITSQELNPLLGYGIAAIVLITIGIVIIYVKKRKEEV